MVNVADTWIVRFVTPEGLQVPEGLDRRGMADRNAALLTGHFHECLTRMAGAGVLGGITIHSKQQFCGTMCVSGSEEKLHALREYLDNTGDGDLTENVELRGIEDRLSPGEIELP